MPLMWKILYDFYATVYLYIKYDNVIGEVTFLVVTYLVLHYNRVLNLSELINDIINPIQLFVEKRQFFNQNK